MTRIHRPGLFALFSALAIASTFLLRLPCACGADEIAVKTGDTIAFLGDSITAYGAGTPGGYVRLAISGLDVADVKATAIPAGVSGNTSKDMLARLDRDVLSKKPTWMTLSCGVNDVWHGEKGVAIDQYKKNITQIVDRATAAGIKVVILTSTMIGEDPSNSNNQKLAAYNDFLRSLAKDKNLPVADLNADMQAELKQLSAEPAPKGNLLTIDGVHMNPVGNQMMASGVLKAFGVSETQMGKIHDSWLDIPSAVELASKLRITEREYSGLRTLAAERNVSVDDLVNAEVEKALQTLAKSTDQKPATADK